MENQGLRNLTIAIKGAGEMASAVAWRLHRARLNRIVMMETARPRAVRRWVAFCEAIHTESHTVEGVTAVKAGGRADILNAWKKKAIAVSVDPSWTLVQGMESQIVVDAILAKRNLGTTINEAPLVIGLGPGFSAGKDVDMVVETQRGHDLGRILTKGAAEENSGIPGQIEGYSHERVLRAPIAGRFNTSYDIGKDIRRGDIIGEVAGRDIVAGIDGVIRGLLRSETAVEKGVKLGDIDPRGMRTFCSTISDKARAIAGSVLECVLRYFNRA